MRRRPPPPTKEGNTGDRLDTNTFIAQNGTYNGKSPSSTMRTPTKGHHSPHVSDQHLLTIQGPWTNYIFIIFWLLAPWNLTLTARNFFDIKWPEPKSHSIEVDGWHESLIKFLWLGIFILSWNMSGMKATFQIVHMGGSAPTTSRAGHLAKYSQVWAASV